jgi:2'-5' RNA ligase
MGVALLLPEDLTIVVDGLRRMCGDRTLGRVPAHVTVLPPVNVRADALATAEEVVRAAADAAEPFCLDIGPVATFHPVTPVAYLRVAPGSDGALERLHALRAAVATPPLLRSERFAYVPHVTLVDGSDPEALAGLVAGLTWPLGEFVVDALHLLEERTDADGVRRWRPVLTAPFGATARLQRGGVSVDLHVERLDRGWTVTAREHGATIGRLVAWADGLGTARVLDVAVVPSRQGLGIGALLVRAALDHAEATGVHALHAHDHPFLRYLGFAVAPGAVTLTRDTGGHGRQ